MKRVSAPGVPSINCFYVLIQTHSITASKFARICIPSVSPNSLDHRLQGHLQTRSITASKVHTSMVFQVHISTLTRSQPPSVSPNSLYYGLQVCYGGIKPRFNKTFINFKYSRLTQLLFLSSSYPKTQPLVLIQELPLKTIPVFFLIVNMVRIDMFLER